MLTATVAPSCADIKGANILVDNNGTIKLTDFGAANQLADIVNSVSGCRTVAGTPYWMAPEGMCLRREEERQLVMACADHHQLDDRSAVIMGKSSYGQRVDIWSVGATVLEMLTGRPPFHHLSPMAALLLVGTTPDVMPELPEGISREARHFLVSCFQ